MKFSLIGTGRIAFLLEEDPLRYKPCTHMGAVQWIAKKKRNIKWNFLCDINENRLRQALQFVDNKYSSDPVKTTRNYKEVIESKPDILIIASDTITHYEILMASINNNIRKIVVEKPIALDKKQAQNINKAALKNDTHIWINYERRYHEKYIRLKNHIENWKTYGRPLYFRGWFASPQKLLFKKNKQNEGILLHDTTHLVDLVQFLFGKISKSSPQTWQISEECAAHKLQIKCSSGINGDILTTSGSQFFHLELEVLFEKAKVSVGNGFFRVEKAETSPYYKDFYSLSNPVEMDKRKIKQNENPFIQLYQDVISDNFNPEYLNHACDNIKILT